MRTELKALLQDIKSYLYVPISQELDRYLTKEELVSRIEEELKKDYTLYFDQPIPTITQEMVYSAQSVAFNAEEDYMCLMEEYLRQHGWESHACDDWTIWQKESEPGKLDTYYEVKDAYEEQIYQEGRLSEITTRNS